MKVLGYLFLGLGLMWLVELVAYIAGSYKPEPFTIGVMMFLTAYLNFKWSKEYFEES